MDLVYVGLVGLLFGSAVLLIRMCERLQPEKSSC